MFGKAVQDALKTAGAGQEGKGYGRYRTYQSAGVYEYERYAEEPTYQHNTRLETGLKPQGGISLENAVETEYTNEGLAP